MKTGGSEYGLSEETMVKVLSLMGSSNTVTGSIRLGNLLIVGIPGEMTAELGMFIKLQVRQTTGIQHVVIGGLANEWVSYILSAKEYEQGGLSYNTILVIVLLIENSGSCAGNLCHR